MMPPGGASRWMGAGLAGLLLLAVGAWALRSPRLDRTWDSDVRVLAGVAPGEDGRIALSGIRDWRYGAGSVVDSTTWFDAILDPEDIREVWMYEQELGAGGRVAHTFLVFEFGPGAGDGEGDPRARWLGLSVETRREVGETYSILGGMLRNFEITHIWATERDLVRRRVEYLDYPLTRYRLTIPPEVRSRVFRKLTTETAALAAAPRWYHTALNNCTSSLIRYVNESEPGAIPWHPSWVLTGGMDGYLEELGFLEGASAERIDRAFLARQPLR